jgi:hypothetical protein
MIEYLISTVLIIALLGICYRFANRYYLSYLRRHHYSRILQTVNAVYQQKNTHFLAQQAREDHSNDSFIYGEIDVCTLLDLLAYIKPTANDIFFDLGSGAGKALVATKLRYPNMKVVGIECLQPLHDFAEETGQSFPAPHALYLNEDFLTADFSEATILLVNATAYSTATWKPLLTRLQALKSGTKIIVTSKKLPSTGFIQRYGAMEKMSWGLCTTRIYEKL